MAGQTPRFNLNFFGGDTPGDFDDDVDKYTGEDRLTIDRLFAAFEGHNHHLSAASPEPSSDPTAVNAPTGGNLPGGTTYYYVVSFVNADGLETICGDEVSVDTPELLLAPALAQGEPTSGGALIPGQYYFALTAKRGAEESPLSEPVAITVLNDGDRSVTLTLPALGDATSFQIWRQKDDDPGWTRVGTSNTGTYVDDGSVPAGQYGDPSNEPPQLSFGSDTNAVTIALTGDDVTNVQKVSAWRIYRTETSGVYSAESLVHEVIERINELDPTTALVTSWIDDGDALLTGGPKIFTQELSIPPFVFDSAPTLPDATDFPVNYPFVSNGVLYLAGTTTWVPAGSRGVAVYTGTGDPTGAEPSGSRNGDLFIDTATGDIYLISGL